MMQRPKRDGGGAGLRIVYEWPLFVAGSFSRRRGFMLAAGLSYTTVLSLVPFLAVAFSAAKGFGLYNAPALREALLTLTAGKEEIADAILTYVGNTSVTALGAIGVATLFLTSMSLLASMEEALNAIWRVGRQRGVWSRFSNFISVILVCPVFILAAFSATAAIQQVSAVRWLMGFETVGEIAMLSLRAAPYLMIWAALFIVYKFVPNRKVGTLAALAGSLIAAVAWQLTQAVYIRYQVGVTGYNAIYGGFAQIPMLLVWLYLSWLIVLIGAQTAYAFEHFQVSRLAAPEALSPALRRRAVLEVALTLAGRALNKGRLATARELARTLGLSEELATYALARLAELSLAAPVAAGVRGAAETWALTVAPGAVAIGDLVAGDDGLGSGRANPPAPYEPVVAVEEAVTQALRRAAPMSLEELYYSVNPDAPRPGEQSAEQSAEQSGELSSEQLGGQPGKQKGEKSGEQKSEQTSEAGRAAAQAPAGETGAPSASEAEQGGSA